jgi:hypothetical protein
MSLGKAAANDYPRFCGNNSVHKLSVLLARELNQFLSHSRGLLQGSATGNPQVFFMMPVYEFRYIKNKIRLLTFYAQNKIIVDFDDTRKNVTIMCTQLSLSFHL